MLFTQSVSLEVHKTANANALTLAVCQEAQHLQRGGCTLGY